MALYNTADTIAHAAREYVKAGLCLVPIQAGTKRPAGKAWQRRSNAISTLSNVSTLAGVGIAHAWSRTCALDIDDFHATDKLLAGNGINLGDLLLQHNAVHQTQNGPMNGVVTGEFYPRCPSRF